MPTPTQTPTQEVRPARQRLGRVYWQSLLTAMNTARMDDAALAARLTTDSDPVKARTIDSYIRGEREPSLERLEQIAEALGIRAADLLEDRPRKKTA